MLKPLTLIDEQGIFFSANCYVISLKEENLLIVYEWIGSESKKEDQEICEKYLQKLSENQTSKKKEFLLSNN